MKNTFDQLISDAETTKEKLFISAVWLFSSRGVDRVGIRELCHSVNIKESSFYNHFPGKDALILRIFARYLEIGHKTLLTHGEVDDIIETANVDRFFPSMMEKFLEHTSNPLFQMMRRIVLMESFVNPQAAETAKNTLYTLRKESMERGLRGLMDKGLIRELDEVVITTEYCYTASEMLDEYLMFEFWNNDTSDVTKRLMNHVQFFTDLIKK
jgi:AcrR family transcriptional regulator